MRADPGPHYLALADAVKARGRPTATLEALDRAVQGAIGHKLFTVLLFHAANGETERFYTSHPGEYPVGGRKPAKQADVRGAVQADGAGYI